VITGASEGVEKMTVAEKVRAHVAALYPDADASTLVPLVLESIGLGPTGDAAAGNAAAGDASAEGPAGRFGEDDVVLITYGDSLRAPQRRGLDVLCEFVDRYLADAISTVHVLPFFPSSSDGGFAVVDYCNVDPALGTWTDIEALSRRGRVMADVILNHGSAQSSWFAQFRAGEEPGCNFFVTAPEGTDTSSVVRPRTHPLLQPFDTADGTRWVWCTFSRDQVDFDFANPAVLIEFCRIINLYLARGVDRLRLDAVAYVWKELGTSSIHLDQTHEIIRLLRTLLDVRSPETLLITETNVPHDENVSYFGSGDEAHVVYNFTLAPLVVHAALSGDCAVINHWARRVELPKPGTSYLNFLASHDGLGLRPAEGWLSDSQLSEMGEVVRALGGAVSSYATSTGDRPYELNCSLSDLLAGPDCSTADRFFVAHALMAAFAGIPAFYIHSLLATPGDTQTPEITGVARDINRARLEWDELHQAVLAGAQATDLARARLFDRMRSMIELRRQQPAFHPNAPQEALPLGRSLVGLRRQSLDGGQTIWALHNFGADVVTLAWDALPGAGSAGVFVDVLDGSGVDRSAPVQIAPMSARWITTIDEVQQ